MRTRGLIMTGKYLLTKHAKRQMDARRITAEAVVATLTFGRRVSRQRCGHPRNRQEGSPEVGSARCRPVPTRGLAGRL